MKTQNKHFFSPLNEPLRSACQLLILLFCLVCSAFSYATVNNGSANDAAYMLKKQTLKLRYLHEVVTASLLDYAVSSDIKSLYRYQDHEIKLSSLQANLLQRQQIEDQDLITQIDHSHEITLTLENQIVNLSRAGDTQGAMQVINSHNYRQNKSTYLASLLTYVKRLESRIEQTNTNTPTVALTAEEQRWIRNNIVVVSVEHWPPILLLNDKNELDGLAGKLLKNVAERTGLRLELITGEWGDLLTKFKAGEIDLIPDTYYTDELAQIGHYSNAYYTFKERFFVLNKSKIKTKEALADKTIAIPKGYSTIAALQSRFPEITILETNSIKESLSAVLSGKADALFDAEIVIMELIKGENVKSLKMISDPVFPDSNLHFLSAKNEPILHAILEKGLASISRDELDNKNLQLLNSRSQKQDEYIADAQRSNNLLWASIMSVLLLIILAVVIRNVILKGDERSLALQFGSKSFRRIAMGTLLALTLISIAFAAVVIQYAHEKSTDTIQYNLNTQLNSTHQRLTGWMQFKLGLLTQLGKNSQLTDLVEQLQQSPADKQALLSHPLQSEIRDFFASRHGVFGEHGFFIISPEMLTLSSEVDNYIGLPNLINLIKPRLLQQVLAGKGVFIPPVQFDNAGKSPLAMFFAAPLVDKQGKVIAILAQRIDPAGAFSVVITSGYIGNSGQTYTVDNNGLLLSKIRFEKQVQNIGLIKGGERAILNLTIADPGVNLTAGEHTAVEPPQWSLTEAAQEISAHLDGINLVGYRDYRGVDVVGQWRWDDSLHMGIVTEVDIEEAFALFTIIKYIVFGVLITALLLIFGCTLFTLNIGERATRALTRSHNELEALIEDRTLELNENMARTRTIIDTASDGIVVVNNQGIIQEFSPSAERIFGYAADQVIDKNISMLMDEPFVQVVNDMQDTTQELQGVRRSGRSFDMELSLGAAILGGERTFTALVRDISTRKEAEREILLAREKAEDATQAKSDFLANMSHEIRTPMNAIIGMSYLALQTQLNKKQVDYVNKIHLSANALLGIINDILDFSKIEAGKLELESLPFSLNDTLDNLINIVSVNSKAKGLELLIDRQVEIPDRLIGDSLRLGQILINLVNNAVKFTEQGEIIIRIEQIALHNDEVTLRFSVIDSGIGMTEQQVSKLFQSFSQADASTTRKYGGTGLGLTISKTLSELMGGEIGVESRIDEGSTFHFTACFTATTDNPKTALLSAPCDIEAVPVLVVDDSAAAREILYNLSESLKFAADVAASGGEALEKIKLAEQQGQPFKLLFCDWQMPIMDGLQLARQIKADSALQHPPKIIMLTAYDLDKLHKQAADIQLDGYLSKPVTASSLLDASLSALGDQTETNANNSYQLDVSATATIQGAHILLVEDNVINQQIAVELLEIAGLQVSVADNGKIALDKVASQEFDAILMDIQMPIMDGYTATAEIRKLPEKAHLPIIAMTANAMSGDKERCIAAGMNDHLPKPIDPENVFKTLRKYVESTPQMLSEVTHNLPQTDVAMPELPGFDIDRAIARMGGSINSYYKTLTRVVATESDAMQRLTQYLQDADNESAIRVAHTIRGVAGNIGANALSKQAELLELSLADEALDNHSEQVNTLIKNTQKSADEAFALINNALAKMQTEHTQTAFDPEKLTSLCEQLEQQIEDFDSESSDTAEQLLEMLADTDFEVNANKLSTLLSEYDFDAAQAALQELSAELKA